MAGRAQTWATNCLVSLRLFFTWYVPAKAGTSAVGAALWRAGLPDKDRVRWNASLALAAMVTPRAVGQR
jgi:hypothetical protein